MVSLQCSCCLEQVGSAFLTQRWPCDCDAKSQQFWPRVTLYTLKQNPYFQSSCSQKSWNSHHLAKNLHLILPSCLCISFALVYSPPLSGYSRQETLYTDHRTNTHGESSASCPWAGSGLPLVGDNAGRDRKVLLGRICSDGQVGVCLFTPSSALTTHRLNAWGLLCLESRNSFWLQTLHFRDWSEYPHSR